MAEHHARGGYARAANQTPEQLSEQGRRAVQARWAKRGAKRRAAAAMKRAWARKRKQSESPAGVG